MPTNLSIEKLKSILSYDHKTGIFTWVKNVGTRGKIGCKAGYMVSTGYVGIVLSGEKYLAHRLAYLYHYGEQPDNIDHINGDREDNAISNLRSVTKAENLKNKCVRKDNKSGIQGVCRTANGKRWRARIRNKGVEVSLGTYDKKEDAKDAVEKAMEKYEYHYNHGRKNK